MKNFISKLLRPSDSKLEAIKQIHAEHQKSQAAATSVATWAEQAHKDANAAIDRCVLSPSVENLKAAQLADESFRSADRISGALIAKISNAGHSNLETDKTKRALLAAFQVLASRMSKTITDLQSKHATDLAAVGLDLDDGQEIASSGPLRTLGEKHARLNAAISFIAQQLEVGGSATSPWGAYQEFILDIVE